MRVTGGCDNPDELSGSGSLVIVKGGGLTHEERRGNG